MNILPKKRWHVRTKENIARVRRDEAEAAEKEKHEKLRIENADREARLSLLKHKSKQKLQEEGIETFKFEDSTAISSEHINLFQDFDYTVKTTNKEHDKEVKDIKEEYEKKIGYLTYLGQDTNEVLKKRNWYEVLPEQSRFSRSNEIKDTYDKLVLKDEDGKPKRKELDFKDGEVSWKAKQHLDPINLFKSYCHDIKNLHTKCNTSGDLTGNIKNKYNHESSLKHKNKKRKHNKEKDNKDNKLQKLREARLKREQQEKYRTEQFLTGLNKTNTNETSNRERISVFKVKAKYNSQFNPELARQNYT